MDTKGFTTYLEGKNLASLTIALYIRSVGVFFSHLKKEETEITKPDILKHLEYLKNSRKQQNKSRKIHLTAINHYFSFLYNAGQIAKNPASFLEIRGVKRKTLHKIYTPDELDELLDSYYQLFVRGYDYSRFKGTISRKQSELGRERNAAILTILVHQGVFTSEIIKMETDDLDLRKATIKIRGSKKHNERTLPLKASQMGILMHYLQNIRPQLLEYQGAETEKLFLALPAIDKKKKDGDMTDKVFSQLTAQIKTIDRQFTNSRQIRASVITHWIKTHGLRKAQNLAGHKNVISTEEYLSNNLDDLTNDINKLHPFNL